MFIGREKELADLNALYATDQFQMPVIYGRRRVGKSTTYNAIIEAMASGAAKINEIATKIHSDTATVSYCLKSLITIGIVEKRTAITDETNRKKTSYVICDNMFRFWYRFVPNGIGGELIQN